MKTPITIKPIIDHEQYYLNGHVVYRDTQNEWVCKTDLSTKELAAFKRYEKLVIKNPAFKKHTKATYII
ncbi:MAG TPA: hypothetical protein VF677_12640 [Flavobacterium sp.]|jgi:hypothetical protein